MDVTICLERRVKTPAKVCKLISCNKTSSWVEKNKNVGQYHVINSSEGANHNL